MSDKFDERLKKAIERGRRRSAAQAAEEAKRRMTEQELRALHTEYRIALTEHIDTCLKRLQEHVPGFQFETILSDRGWGAAVSRDDRGGNRRSVRSNFFSRLEMVIRPFSEYHILELTAKGTVRNREYFNRSFYQELTDVDLESFHEMIDRWSIEFAELYAAKS